ncbi:disease resistance protein RPV1 [Rosa chinensis]|uniref:disease resistance protein RPV1 n=1 Tax=Rosa chinensis TaxID=74649 RepID=UPI001AD91D20|nr:disease resistance protein RPV1 [Rosa chinensis]
MASLINEAAASSSSSSLPLSSTDHQNHYRHQVFLSFRGDTRFNFTDHLYKALCDRGIETFRDADKLRIGEEISAALLKAIEESRVSIVVFSQNYASSRWCLDELVKILDCRKSEGQEVRPVFYKVNPSDVRYQKGAFGDAFAKLERRYKDSMGKWKATLKEAADLSGWTYEEERYETEFINDIVEELSTQVVNPSCKLPVAEHPIGLESCRQDVNILLHAEENTVRMVGIWGPGGIGKTTIAKDVFNSIHDKFKRSCFLADVRSTALVQLQEKLLSRILNSTLKVSSVDEGVSFIQTKMRHEKVLLILDDVSDSSQLQKLVPSPDCFGPGSRILVTTRDKRWLITHEVEKVYEVKMLNDHHALELFCLHAFRENGPPSDYLELAQRAVCYAQGLPLALIVLGSHLFRRRIEEWKAAIDSCKGGPQADIQKVLKLSYDALKVDLKELFLDIACFFKGWPVARVKLILEACYNHKTMMIGIARLQEKALIRIDGHEIWMHDLIEEMGRDIVFQNSPDEPGERSRVWSGEDVNDVLTYNTGTKEVKGIQVSSLPWRSSTISLNAKSFSGMEKLRYISMSHNVNYEFFSGDIDYLSKQLRWLDWPKCPLQCFPSDFHANKLVYLDISYSCRITRLWKGHKVLISNNLFYFKTCLIKKISNI